MHLVLIFTADAHESGETQLVHIRLLDDDGKLMMDLNGNFPLPEGPGPTVELQQIFALQMLQFPHPGRYEFHIVVNGKTRANLPLDIQQTPPQG